MTQRIYNCPLQHLETLGAPGLLATLTGDINAIAQASMAISLTIVNLAVLVGIFGYLCSGCRLYYFSDKSITFYSLLGTF
jgi:putative pyoverdin transport system ATP-binding/permease protein